jgi:MFS family permease
LESSTSHDPYLALRSRDFRLFLAGNLVASLAARMLALAIGWELYERTSSALALGVVGLVELLPILLLSLVTGQVADRHNRRTVVVLSQLLVIAGSLGLAALSHWAGPLVGVYACLLLLGIGAAFEAPAASALAGEVVAEESFENSASWRTIVGEAASVVGPALGGLLIAATGAATLVYVLNALAALAFVALLLLIRGSPTPRSHAVDAEEPTTLRAIGEVVAFFRRTPVLFGAITLDLFAVLFGGATTLLPIFAKDILQVGPAGLGWLQAAPAFGALGVALFLAHRPPLQRAGLTLLLAVAGFGAATIVFGLSRSFGLSLAMLAILGGLDCVSMVVRDTLMLTRTPNALRGRVAAIEGLFTSSSNQLGGFASGLTAQLVGPVLSVVGGGIGTIVVVLVIAAVAPELRRMRTMREGISKATAS